MKVKPTTLWCGTVLIALAANLPVDRARAQHDPPPARGPYYFVSDTLGSSQQFYWREPQRFAGIDTIPNLNLLATVLGDTPGRLQFGQRPVPRERYDFQGGNAVREVELQPFAFTIRGSSDKRPEPPGVNLRRFLDDPLGGGQSFDLTLPFLSADVALSTHSALIRRGDAERVWHFGVDFDSSLDTTREFDVVAAHDGTVAGTRAAGSSVVLRHTAANGTPFLTIYQHLSPASKAALVQDAPVVRGQKLGRVERNSQDYAHLHFAVAVLGPARRVGNVDVPELWYLLDPFGVYDYRRNHTSAEYNYVRRNTLAVPTRGVVHEYAWRTDPPIGSLLLSEDCLSFDPGNLAIRTIAVGTLYRITDGSRDLFSFPTLPEATTALRILQHYRANRSCFVGRPGPSFQYLLAGGRGPAGSFSGEDCLRFDPAAIRIEPLRPPRQFDGRYRMTSGNQRLFVFPNMLQAGNALSRIRQYGFTRTCFVGRPNASLQYMR